MRYSTIQPPTRHNQRKRKSSFLVLVSLVLLVLLGFTALQMLSSDEQNVEEAIQNEIVFDDSVTAYEQTTLSDAIAIQQIELTDNVTISASLTSSLDSSSVVHDIYVPITAFGSVRQTVTTAELADLDVTLSPAIGTELQNDFAMLLGISPDQLQTADGALDYESIRIIPVTELDTTYQLLTLDGSYYLDNFSSGAFYRTISIAGPGAAAFTNFTLQETLQSEDTYTVKMTGVTALTREMQRKLTAVGGDPLYFSAKIGDFLADADTTHVSNEVSFVENCPYSYTAFCSPPAFIETLKDSGVDIVELTGNHNNDLGNSYNTSTIELYDSLGWETIGGGLNTEDAAKPYIASVKQSTIAFLAYNYPDSPKGGAIAGPTTAGANAFDFSYASIEADIQAAKDTSDFIIINVQYWECYAYPDGYLEFPECDKPIGEQEAVFKQLIDLGADMVIGSSAHQPQTYELYKGKPIYYGLGNLYFEQNSWPGTERGLVLTNYFVDGKLLQTKITPTVYDRDLQTRVMTPEESAFLLDRLKTAR